MIYCGSTFTALSNWCLINSGTNWRHSSSLCVFNQFHFSSNCGNTLLAWFKSTNWSYFLQLWYLEYDPLSLSFPWTCFLCYCLVLLEKIDFVTPLDIQASVQHPGLVVYWMVCLEGAYVQWHTMLESEVVLGDCIFGVPFFMLVFGQSCWQKPETIPKWWHRHVRNWVTCLSSNPGSAWWPNFPDCHLVLWVWRSKMCVK